MIGESYWSTGIILRERSGEWAARLEFMDDGFCEDKSTQGTLTMRYFGSLATAIDTLIKDAQKLGIVFTGAGDEPCRLYYECDGESVDWPPPQNWREILRKQAQRIGWVT